mgnify:CR=1 FL=1
MHINTTILFIYDLRTLTKKDTNRHIQYVVLNANLHAKYLLELERSAARRCCCLRAVGAIRIRAVPRQSFRYADGEFETISTGSAKCVRFLVVVLVEVLVGKIESSDVMEEERDFEMSPDEI